ncbi:hypothetical protein [Rothia dentocariosa]|uniref:hypothetical protein n=1 Tax=Rothia dentocariosa TaxID=2047 RepID=UPI002880A458|nr:hypothetical protein [Rothia dentocariosa]
MVTGTAKDWRSPTQPFVGTMLYVSDPVDVPALKKAAVTFSFDLQTLDSAG